MDEIEDAVTEKRREELRSLNLELEQEEIDEMIRQEQELHREQLKRINVVHKTELAQLKHKHSKEKQVCIFSECGSFCALKWFLL